MQTAHPLPDYLVKRYHHWKSTELDQIRPKLRSLADLGQNPPAMVISCCDSRVHATALFGAEHGDFFLHRNIANLVPEFRPDGNQHGTSAAIEFAVNALKVSHVIVLGHSQCGGVKGCHDMCAGLAPELNEKGSFVGRWMDILRNGYDHVKDITDEAARLRALEEQAVRVSLANLMTFPFVAEAVETGRLTLHGAWTDIGEGALWVLDPESDTFQPV